jgi:ferredoxin
VAGFVPGLSTGPVLLCGPDPMMTAMREMLVGMGVPDAEIHQEAFASPAAAGESQAAAAESQAAAGTAPAAGAAPAAGTSMPGMAATAAAVEPAEAEVAGEGNVRFLRAGRTAELPVGLTLLEAAEEAGVDISFECRSGICGQCKTRLVSGRVSMEVQDALTPADKAKGLILACQARPAGSLVVDA